MSKSKGNVVNPLTLVEKYGADALRFALVFGTASGADIPFSEDKARGMRNFANKLWNIGRFLLLQLDNVGSEQISFYQDSAENRQKLDANDKRYLGELTLLVNRVTQALEKYRFNEAAEALYEFTWHALADSYIEKLKVKMQNAKLKNAEKLQTLSVMLHINRMLLKLLHPFMPFVTEEIWSKIPRKKTDLLIVSSWPK